MISITDQQLSENSTSTSHAVLCNVIKGVFLLGICGGFQIDVQTAWICKVFVLFPVPVNSMGLCLPAVCLQSNAPRQGVHLHCHAKVFILLEFFRILS